MENIEKNEKTEKKIAFLTILISVICLSIAFMAMSKTYKIKVVEKRNHATWKISFKRLSKPILTGDAKVISHPTFNSTAITDFLVVLTKPGDSVTYEFDIANNGIIDAKIGNFYEDDNYCISYSGKYVSSNEEATYCDLNDDGVVDGEDLALQKENFSYTLTYKDSGKKVSKGDILDRGTSRKVVLKIEYKADSSWLPSHNLRFVDMKKIIEYVQKDI